MSLPLKVAWYWLLSLKLAMDEFLGLRLHRALVAEARSLHQEIARVTPWAVHRTEDR